MNFKAVTNKIDEADFFYEKLREASKDSLKSKKRAFYLSAFLSAARSFTFVLQKMCKNNSKFPEFDQWYQNQLEKFEEYDFSEYFKEFRNIVLKEGVTGMNSGSIFTNEKGELVGEIHFSHEEKQFNNINIPKNFIDQAYNYLKILVSIYWDFLVDFGDRVDFHRKHTIVYLKENAPLESPLIYSEIEDHDEEMKKERNKNKLLNCSKPHKSTDKLFEKYLQINRFKN